MTAFWSRLVSLVYLQSEQIIHGTDDDVDGGGATNLSPQIILKIYSTAPFYVCYV